MKIKIPKGTELVARRAGFERKYDTKISTHTWIGSCKASTTECWWEPKGAYIQVYYIDIDASTGYIWFFVSTEDAQIVEL